jgi:hypothetical protein
MKEKAKVFITPPGILSFAHLYHKYPTSKQGNKQPREKWRYQASLLFEPGAPGWDPIRAEVNRLKKLGNIEHCALLEADEHGKDWDGWPGRSVLKTKANETRPRVVSTERGPNGDFIEIAEEDGIVYSGCIVRCSVHFYFYNNDSTGVGCELHNVQFLKDGKPFSGGGGSKPADDFADDNYDTSDFADHAGSVLD